MFKWLGGITRIVREDPLSISPNLKVDLHVKDGEYAGQYHSRIEEITEGAVIVAIPQQRGVAVPLRDGVRVTVRYADPFGLYQFESRIVERVRHPMAALALERPAQSDIRCVLKRAFPRYECDIQVMFRVTDSPDVYHPEATHRVRILDISGGGFSFEYGERIPENSRLRLEITLPDDEPPLRVDGKVVRCQNLPNRRQLTHEMGVEFIDVSSVQRSRIVRAIQAVSGSGSHIGRR